jgi:hypothetical protein
MLTRGCGDLSCDGRRRTTAAGGEGARALAEEGDAEVAGPSGLRGSIREAPAETTRGLKELAVHRRQRIAAAAVLTGGGLWEKIRTEERAEVAGEGAGAPGWWGDADAQALTGRGAVERRAHGGTEEVRRRSDTEGGPRVRERHQGRDGNAGGLGVVR